MAINNDLIAEIISSAKSNIRAADSLAKKPKIAEVHAISRNEQLRLARSAVSMNDILETIKATAMLQDPEFREKIQRVSDLLNSTWNRFA